MTLPDDMPLNDVEHLDVHEVYCGLVPALAAHLARSSARVVEFVVRPNMRPELLASFGANPDWVLEFETGIGYDVARFTRARRNAPPSLNLVGY
ncbi:MAG: hypothetical protein AB7D57_05820 [Desulfovibrionaceae bacterium]